jgi:hypothetical protein
MAGLLLALAGLLLHPSPGSADPSLDSEEQTLVQHINNYRSQNGAPPLILHTQLAVAADWFAHDMATKDYFSHTDSLGRNSGQRAADFGFSGPVGENIAAGFTTGQGVFEGWRDSSGHASNMANANWNVVGLARAYDAGSSHKWYWVAKFGSTQIVSYNAAWGDSDCDGSVTIGDALRIARALVGFSDSLSGCPRIGDSILVDGVAVAWGDIDCDGSITVGDAHKIARRLAGLHVAQPAGCPQIGQLN